MGDETEPPRRPEVPSWGRVCLRDMNALRFTIAPIFFALMGIALAAAGGHERWIGLEYAGYGALVCWSLALARAAYIRSVFARGVLATGVLEKVWVGRYTPFARVRYFVAGTEHTRTISLTTKYPEQFQNAEGRAVELVVHESHPGRVFLGSTFTEL